VAQWPQMVVYFIHTGGHYIGDVEIKDQIGGQKRNFK
jgi:hypothetical protein